MSANSVALDSPSTSSTTSPIGTSRFGKHLVDRAADHQADELRLGDRGDRPVADLLAVAQADEVVGDAEDLVELVGDEDDRAALGLELRDDAEEVVDLVGRQRRGRLVHDDDLRLVRERAGDLDQVLLRDGEALQLKSGGIGASMPSAASAERARICGQSTSPADRSACGP